MSCHLSLVIGFDGLINGLHPLEEPSHCWQQLLLEQGDLFLPIGVIDPGPRDQQTSCGVCGQEPLHGPVAGLHQGNGILRTAPPVTGMTPLEERQLLQKGIDSELYGV